MAEQDFEVVRDIVGLAASPPCAFCSRTDGKHDSDCESLEAHAALSRIEARIETLVGSLAESNRAWQQDQEHFRARITELEAERDEAIRQLQYAHTLASEARAEVERLREALAGVAYANPPCFHVAQARAALAPTKEDPDGPERPPDVPGIGDRVSEGERMTYHLDPKELRGYAYRCGAETELGGHTILCDKAEGHEGSHANSPFVEWSVEWPAVIESLRGGEA